MHFVSIIFNKEELTFFSSLVYNGHVCVARILFLEHPENFNFRIN